ncbi:MAG: hypothetical protein HC941_29900 [Microcoleus sp. SU_5_3]|nr:hypothetical protein [Microcoleus sp. SU_5_3]
MTIWLNAHRSPAIAVWITATFGITAILQVTRESIELEVAIEELYRGVSFGR